MFLDTLGIAVLLLFYVLMLVFVYVCCIYSGGTLDVTVHEIDDDGSIKEIFQVTGGPYGGIKVNEQFESLLDELFGAERLNQYRWQFPSDWLSLMNEFEGKKRGKRILDGCLMTNIRLPRSFVSLVTQSRSSAMERYGSKEVKLKNNEYLSLSSGIMKKLFTPVVDRIKDHLKSLQRNPQLAKVQSMLFVGGFADSSFLQEEIKREFSGRYTVLIPHHSNAVVVQGAVMFGKKPAKITQRVMSTTYGANCSRDFIEGFHPEEKKFVADGIEKCGDLFSCFVKEKRVVKVGEKIKKTFHPVKAKKKSLSFGFYVTSEADTQFVTDPGVTKIGSLKVKSPDTWRGRDRDIEVSMYFGGTEITATAWDISSGNRAQTTLDFFCRS